MNMFTELVSLLCSLVFSLCIFVYLGRTGRVGNPGRAISLVDAEENADVVKKIVTRLAEAKLPVDDWLAEVAEGASGGGDEATANGDGGDDDDEWG